MVFKSVPIFREVLSISKLVDNTAMVFAFSSGDTEIL